MQTQRLKHTAWVLVFLLTAVGGAVAQQFGPWSPPVNLGPVINSASQDQHPALSKNGLSLYFTSNRPGGQGGQDIWVARRASVDDPWEAPDNLGPVVNSSGIDVAPNLTTDGHYLYFHSSRTTPDVNGQTPCGGVTPPANGSVPSSFDLYVSHRKDKYDDMGWEPPVNLGCVINSDLNDAGPNYFEDPATGEAVLYFTRLVEPAVDNWDIYQSVRQPDGSWGVPYPVTEFVGAGRDTRTAIRRRDGLEMIISSQRPGTIGSQDLWVSTRESTLAPWTPLENLGPVVNSTAFDGAPALSWDGTTLVFFSQRPGGSGLNDLYVSTRSKLSKE